MKLNMMTQFSFDTMKCLILLLSFFFISVEGDRHLNVNGPFGKRHSIGDEPSPHACNCGSDIFYSKNLTVENINVSTTVYSSNEQIVIDWIPISKSCVDDFVGIYFIDIDSLNGKYI
jgi:hypothetical protein